MAPVGSGLAVMVVIDGVVGLVAGAALAYGVHRHSRRSLTQPERTMAAQRALELPIAVEVLAACLVIGATQEQALRAVASGLGGTLAADFHRVAGALAVGAEVGEAWSLVPASDVRSLAALLSRAHLTGAAVAPQLWMLADQHRQAARTVAMDAARTLGVRSTGPLGLCFLPAFVLVTVVPLVLSLLETGT
ncbi:MAG TPA: type II secretion system F family protein [Actinomycetes bacterium]|nr:type II secretion system F family protein [Actinomycetes bacterium]